MFLLEILPEKIFNKILKKNFLKFISRVKSALWEALKNEVFSFFNEERNDIKLVCYKMNFKKKRRVSIIKFVLNFGRGKLKIYFHNRNMLKINLNLKRRKRGEFFKKMEL